MSDRVREPVVVVGVDGSKSSLRALEWALRQAEHTGASVTAVQAWEVPVGYGGGAMVLPGSAFAEHAEAALAEVAAAAATEHPDVRLDRVVAEGHPAKVLLKQAKDADLLVVGSRGHGGIVGALIGSVSTYCVHHATCPVVVIRGED